MASRKDILDHKDEILQWIEEGQSKAFIAAQLHCKGSTLNTYLGIMGIEYAGTPGKKNNNYPIGTYKKAEEFLTKGTTIPSSTLREKLFKEGLKEKKCESCGNSEWIGEEIPLELHHINGDHYDNTFENLMILCPNCHAIIHRKEKENAVHHRKTNAERKLESNNFCVDCGAPIHAKSTRCPECSKKFARVVERPEREDFKKMVRNDSFTHLSSIFGVSDKSIVKWCVAYGLPSKRSEIKKYSDEEWEKL